MGDELQNSPFFQGALAKLLVEYPRGYAVLMGHLNQESQAAMARKAGISRNAVRLRLLRAKALMQQYIVQTIEGDDL